MRNLLIIITVIIITHQMSVVESTCRHVAILEEGQVVEQGSHRTLLDQDGYYKRLYELLSHAPVK